MSMQSCKLKLEIETLITPNTLLLCRSGEEKTVGLLNFRLQLMKFLLKQIVEYFALSLVSQQNNFVL